MAGWNHLYKGELLAVGAGSALEVHVCLVCLLDHVHGELLVQALVVVAKLVGRLAVGHLVVTEPVQYLCQLPRELTEAMQEGSQQSGEFKRP